MRLLTLIRFSSTSSWHLSSPSRVSRQFMLSVMMRSARSSANTARSSRRFISTRSSVSSVMSLISRSNSCFQKCKSLRRSPSRLTVSSYTQYIKFHRNNATKTPASCLMFLMVYRYFSIVHGKLLKPRGISFKNHSRWQATCGSNKNCKDMQQCKKFLWFCWMCEVTVTFKLFHCCGSWKSKLLFTVSNGNVSTSKPFYLRSSTAIQTEIHMVYKTKCFFIRHFPP